LWDIEINAEYFCKILIELCNSFGILVAVVNFSVSVKQIFALH